MSRPKLLFLATEDWFVRSHFLPLVRRANEEGYEPVVAARMGEARADLEAAGARTIELPDERGVYGMAALAASVLRLRGVLQREQPAIVHAIALRPILLASLAAAGAPAAAHVLAVTGRGYLATGARWRERRALDLVAALIAGRVRAGRAILFVENTDDAVWVGGRDALPRDRVVLSPGAGVELDRYRVSPEPMEPPIRIGFVSRLVRSKGADLAVEAVRLLRDKGMDVTLSIAGAPDFDNPAAVSQAELAMWEAMPGVEIVGRITDVAGFWADKHIACLPSRGGEGLPRSLLEAAACGRPIVTTNVPGCRDFVTPNIGMAVRPNDPAALVAAFETLAGDQLLRRKQGIAARVRVEEAYTVEAAADAAAKAWRAAVSARETGAATSAPRSRY